MKILIVGAKGQLGQELQKTKPANLDIVALSHAQLDITNAQQVQRVVQQHKPDCIINAAAYTAVDVAEQEPEKAYAVNASGAAHLAQAAILQNARLIHISTDYVFDGKQQRPYTTLDATNPINVYGASKLEGEKAVLSIAPEHSLIIRASWVYSYYGKNFVKRILEILTQADEIRMVADQIGAPTWTKNLANVIWQAVNKVCLHGIYHWSDEGSISKYDWTIAIVEEAKKLKLLNKEISIAPIKTSDFPSLAERPLYSVLDCRTTYRDFAVTAQPWRIALQLMLLELKNNG